jgi:hypothetical protein
MQIVGIEDRGDVAYAMASDRRNLGFSAAGEREACNGSAPEIMPPVAM